MSAARRLLSITNFRSALLAAIVSAYVVMWIGSVGSHFLRGGNPPGADWASGVFLLLAGLIVVMTTSRSNLKGLLAASVIGFAAEVIGVRYDFLFGDYFYTDALMFRLLGVPVVMASAWMALVAYVKQMLLGFKLPGWLEVVAASCWMTAMDLLIDPLAAGSLDCWRWRESGAYYGIPARNFLGWFAVSLLVFGLLRATIKRDWQPNFWARGAGLSFALFFTLLALAHRLTLVACIGAGLCLAHFLILSASDQPGDQSSDQAKAITPQSEQINL